jgi:acyl-CoA thioester hydrolase
MQTIFSHRLEVRFRDCDPLGHANNAVYFTYLEQARFAHWRSLRDFLSHKDVPGVILARAEIDFRRPARYGDMLEVRIGVAAVGRTSFAYEYEIADDAGNLVATAKTVLVMFDYEANKPVPVPDEIRAQLVTQWEQP